MSLFQFSRYIYISLVIYIYIYQLFKPIFTYILMVGFVQECLIIKFSCDISFILYIFSWVVLEAYSVFSIVSFALQILYLRYILWQNRPASKKLSIQALSQAITFYPRHLHQPFMSSDFRIGPVTKWLPNRGYVTRALSHWEKKIYCNWCAVLTMLLYSQRIFHLFLNFFYKEMSPLFIF